MKLVAAASAGACGAGGRLVQTSLGQYGSHSVRPSQGAVSRYQVRILGFPAKDPY